MRRDIRIGIAVLLTAAMASWRESPDASGQAPPTAKAVFAGGCFWCMEGPFDVLPGVISTRSGYTGGRSRNPTYEQVSSGGTGHTEAVEVVYDPAKITYARLLDTFWHNIDPLDGGGQFCDRGDQYRSAVFYSTEAEKVLADASKQRVAERLKRKVVTQIVPADAFYPAEGYHQDYYTKNPARYKFYRWNCGRDQRLKKLWGDEAGH